MKIIAWLFILAAGWLCCSGATLTHSAYELDMAEGTEYHAHEITHTLLVKLLLIVICLLAACVFWLLRRRRDA